MTMHASATAASRVRKLGRRLPVVWRFECLCMGWLRSVDFHTREV